MAQITLDDYRKQMRKDLQAFLGNDVNTSKKIDVYLKNCESRIGKRIKDPTLLLVYKLYSDTLFQMVKLDFNSEGAEGEVTRNANGISYEYAQSRPSDEELAKIPQRL